MNKYPDFKIRGGENAYVFLKYEGQHNIYLLTDGTLGDENSGVTKLYYPSQEAAQQAFDAFMNLPENRDYLALRKEGLSHNIPKDYVFIGGGDKDHPLNEFWGTEVRNPESDGRMGRYKGNTPSFDYYIDTRTWDAKFPELAKQFETPTKMQEITLSEIKTKLADAKKLIGKNVKSDLGGVHREGIVRGVDLHFEAKEFVHGKFSKEFLKENGYVINLNLPNTYLLFNKGTFEVVEQIQVTNHSGQSYTGEQFGDYWQFGCAKISKELINRVFKFLNSHEVAGKDFRIATKVTIGAADFNLETLQKLVDADTNK